MLVTGPMQTQPTSVEFVPEEHTDFIFEVSNWPALLAFLALVGAAALTLAFALSRYRRRRRAGDEP
jgi:hypothetical protein